jgi:pimeloyl-ACP methyl ester carboxylesterase
VEIAAEDDPVAQALEFDGYATLRLPTTPLLRDWGRTEALARRQVDATNWSAAYEQTRLFPIAYFGREEGADACLLAAAECWNRVKGIVACGPSPESLDLELSRVRAPTRIIAGENDDELIRMNRRGMAKFSAPVDLRIVPGSIERREIEVELQLGRMAMAWFDQFVVPPRRADTPEARGIPPGYWPAG